MTRYNGRLSQHCNFQVLGSIKPELANYNPQKGHTIRKNSPEGRTCCLKSDQLQVVNIFSANKVATLCSVDILYYVC